jgi:hypothetical protein
LQRRGVEKEPRWQGGEALEWAELVHMANGSGDGGQPSPGFRLRPEAPSFVPAALRPARDWPIPFGCGCLRHRPGREP